MSHGFLRRDYSRKNGSLVHNEISLNILQHPKSLTSSAWPGLLFYYLNSTAIRQKYVIR